MTLRGCPRISTDHRVPGVLAPNATVETPIGWGLKHLDEEQVWNQTMKLMGVSEFPYCTNQFFLLY